MFVCCKCTKPTVSYEPVKHRISDENAFWRQNTLAAACFPCLLEVQYKNKCSNHLDNVSGLTEHAVNLVGYHVDSVLSCKAIHSLLSRFVGILERFSDSELTNVNY